MRHTDVVSMNIVLDNRVRIVDQLPVDVHKLLKEEFAHRNPQHAKKKAMGFPAWDEPAIIRTYVEGPGHQLSLPRGGFYRVRAILREAGIAYKVEDNRTEGEHFHEVIPQHRLKLYEYQQTALEIMVEHENCLLRAGTGSGKTSIAFAVAANIGLPTLVIVWSGNLFDQWVIRCQKEFGLDKRDIGTIRSGKCNVKPITIAMQQSLAALPKEVMDGLVETFGVVICDEVQRFAAKTLFNCVDPFRSKYRFGISADESRKDGKEFLIYDLFGKPRVDIPKEDLIESGHVLDVEIRVIPTDFVADWYTGEGNDFNDLLDAMAAEVPRNDLILDAVSSEVAAGEQCIVLAHHREHCALIDRLLSVEKDVKSGLLIGGQDYAAEFRRTRFALEEGILRCGVGTYQAIGQALDLPKVAVGVASTPMANNRQMFGQVRGRLCRIAKGKKTARLYYLWDRNVYGISQLQNIVRWNRQVLVKSGDEWVEGREYLRRLRAA